LTQNKIRRVVKTVKYSIMKYLALLVLIISQFVGFSQNPIIPNKGANDPHIRIIDGKAYLAASHDKSIENGKHLSF
jgi:hypothetical protein